MTRSDLGASGSPGRTTYRPFSPLALRPVVVRALLALLLPALLLSSMTLAGCGPRGGISDRYVAEKLAWRARQLERAMGENPEIATDEMRARLESTYAEIVRLFPPPDADGAILSDIELDVARISGVSRLRLASLSAAAGDVEESRRLLSTVVEHYGFSRSLSVEAANVLATSYEVSEMPAEASAVLEQMFERWPPAEEKDGTPDPRVLRAPLRTAGIRAAAGLEEPGEAFERARDHYRRVLSEWSATPTGRATLATIAESYEFEGRWSDAILTYERLDREYGRPESRASLWLKLGDLYALRTGDVDRGKVYYLSVEEIYPDTPNGGTASVNLARFDLGERNFEGARERLESVLSRFEDDETMAATAAHLIALSYEAEGRMDSAISRYGEVAAAYPTTLYGLSAPIHVAELYASMGEEAAAEAALDRAVDHYERVVRDYADTPAELAARGNLISARGAQENWSEMARVLFETATRFPRSDAAPGMMFQAAQLYETKLDDPEAAQEILRAIATTFEGTEAAAEAIARLED